MCRRQCTSLITAEGQQALLERFWARQDDMVGRYEYIARHVEELSVQRRIEAIGKRFVSRRFFLTQENERISVSLMLIIPSAI